MRVDLSEVILPRSKQGGRNAPTISRNASRYETSALPPFNFGEVLDLSATGMRLRRPGKPIVVVGAIEKFVLVAGAGPLVLRGKVMWVRRPALFGKTHELGVQFINVDKGCSDRLVHIGQFGFDCGVSLEVPQEERVKRKVLASIEVEDLYPILGVRAESTEEEIGRAYRVLVRRWHPDVCRDEGAAEQMARISKAYKILRDRELRARYDEMRAISQTAGHSTARSPGTKAA